MKVPDSGPKRKLLDATERLVVEKGFDLVSVRDITGAVKANVAAVNYHFGSREGLMELVMQHVMEAVNATRTETLEALTKGKPTTEAIVGSYVHSVIAAASRVDMDLAFFLKLAGRVMVFPTVTISPSLADERKQVNELYLDAIAKASAQSKSDELAAAWAFFEAGLGQSLVNLRADHTPSAQAEQWIRFGVLGLGVAQIHTVAPLQTPVPVVVEKPVVVAAEPPVPKTTPEPAPAPAPEAVAPEPAKPKAKSPRAASKKQDDQNMLFDL